MLKALDKRSTFTLLLIRIRNNNTNINYTFNWYRISINHEKMSLFDFVELKNRAFSDRLMTIYREFQHIPRKTDIDLY